VLERFTSRLGPPIAAEEMLLQLVEALKASLRATRAEAWIVDADRVERRVAVPHSGEGDHFVIGERERRQLSRSYLYGHAWAQLWTPALLAGRATSALRIAPVVNEGQALAILVVERPGGEDFTTAEERALTELARHLGLSLHNERLREALEATLADVRRVNSELRASRARIVETADAERRRIERDLHDGAQQQLIALSIDLKLARDALAGDIPAAAARIDHASRAVADAIEELSDLAHGIYPPILREAGLEAAVRMAARRHPSPVAIEAGGLRRQPPGVEAAIYFVVVEALQNAAKHAPDAPVMVTVTDADADADAGGSAVRFEVADAGPGFVPGEAHHGQGMLNICDRIGAIGGTVAWESAPGSGTRVTGSVPAGERAQP
jgi:signal transduction histidine kinase